MALICDYTGQGITLDGTPDGSSQVIRGAISDSTSGQAGTWSGWRGTNYPVKVILDGNGSIIQRNGNNVMFHPGTVVASNCEDDTRYDCINGTCTPSTTYNTPGQYSSLEECEVNCGSGTGTSCDPPNICVPPDYCPPGMVCIPSSQWGQIEGLAGGVKSNACKGQ